jgi:Holliday junction resolvase RusA-like endonuclease
MGKKGKQAKTSVDYDTGIGGIIPSTHQAYSGNSFSEKTYKKEKSGVTHFQGKFKSQIAAETKKIATFPTPQEVFVFIFQYFISKKEYRLRDIDNIAKTILDTLKGSIYTDDGQVKTLLVGKKIDTRVPKEFAYVAVKILSKTQEVDALKTSGIERSVTMFNQLKRQGIL